VVVKRIYDVGSRIGKRRRLIIEKTAYAMNTKSGRFVDVNYPTGVALLLVSIVNTFQKTFKVRHQIKAKWEFEMVRTVYKIVNRFCREIFSVELCELNNNASVRFKHSRC